MTRAGRLTWRLTGVTLAVLLAASVLTAWRALTVFEPAILTELNLKAAALGGNLANDLARALGYGIPFDRLEGVNAAFDTVLKSNPDIDFLALNDAAGHRHTAVGQAPATATPRPTESPSLAGAGSGWRLVERGDHLVTLVPVAAAPGAPPRGVLEVGVAKGVVTQVSRDLAFDIASVLIAFEAVLVVTARAEVRTMPSPAGPRTPSANSVPLTVIRLPLFLFCLSEELSRPFFPAFARSFADTAPWLGPDAVVSLPITLFMLVWALSQPSGALWSDRVGRRSAIMLGAVMGAGGLALTSVSVSLYDLMLWRMVTALGYGLVLISAQGAVVDHTRPAQRAAGMATVIGGLLAAGVCGPLLGGIIADQVGFRPTFVVGAILALAAALTVAALVPRGMKRDATAAPPVVFSWAALFSLMGNGRFLAVSLFSAIPTKIAATAFLFYLLPLFLTAEGASKADIGRVQMLYFLAFILMSPLPPTQAPSSPTFRSCLRSWPRR